jgi:hypothetical protein
MYYTHAGFTHVGFRHAGFKPKQPWAKNPIASVSGKLLMETEHRARGKSSAYCQPSGSVCVPRTTFHSALHSHRSDGKVNDSRSTSFRPTMLLKLGRSVGNNEDENPRLQWCVRSFMVTAVREREHPIERSPHRANTPFMEHSERHTIGSHTHVELQPEQH